MSEVEGTELAMANRFAQLAALVLVLLGTAFGVISGVLTSEWTGAATGAALVAVILSLLLLYDGDASSSNLSEARFVFVAALLVLALLGCVVAFLSAGEMLARVGLSLLGLATLTVLAGAIVIRKRS